ncbi:hypothetical protein KFL_000060360 [Klebsormidium nitens]|uniref:Uncharacterized protein n=1 Tax=Klebsormidium nitens TaxID=105231 RepID=A0A0U9HTG6_KLENI|nr:hypothetical protein KFL_000060360 [Klebsormidium nitens]|eukprot:GAQ77971.1 hypothetical protein KFL_000060360 [Klebsormidium nitens]
MMAQLVALKPASLFSKFHPSTTHSTSSRQAIVAVLPPGGTICRRNMHRGPLSGFSNDGVSSSFFQAMPTWTPGHMRRPKGRSLDARNRRAVVARAFRNDDESFSPEYIRALLFISFCASIATLALSWHTFGPLF